MVPQALVTSLPAQIAAILPGLISKQDAIMRLKPQLLEHLLHPTIDPTAQKKVIAKAR